MTVPVMAPWSLALRFTLEVVALAALGFAGWQVAASPLRWICAVAIPAVAAAAWVTFTVSDDPSRSGLAPVEVNGFIRLGIEFAVFLAGAIALRYTGQAGLANAYTVLVAAHYVTSLDRVQWITNRQQSGGSASKLSAAHRLEHGTNTGTP